MWNNVTEICTIKRHSVRHTATCLILLALGQSFSSHHQNASASKGIYL